MQKSDILKQLTSREADIRAMGVASLSLFGSVARDEAGPTSDVDLAAQFDPAAKVTLFGYSKIADRLESLLGVPVDLVVEPARKFWMQREIDKDRIRVF